MSTAFLKMVKYIVDLAPQLSRDFRAPAWNHPQPCKDPQPTESPSESWVLAEQSVSMQHKAHWYCSNRFYWDLVPLKLLSSYRGIPEWDSCLEEPFLHGIKQLWAQLDHAWTEKPKQGPVLLWQKVFLWVVVLGLVLGFFYSYRKYNLDNSGSVSLILDYKTYFCYLWACQAEVYQHEAGTWHSCFSFFDRTNWNVTSVSKKKVGEGAIYRCRKIISAGVLVQCFKRWVSTFIIRVTFLVKELACGEYSWCRKKIHKDKKNELLKVMITWRLTTAFQNPYANSQLTRSNKTTWVSAFQTDQLRSSPGGQEPGTGFHRKRLLQGFLLDTRIETIFPSSH